MIPWCLSSRQQDVLARTSEFGRAEIAPVADAADRKASIPPGLAQRFHATGLGADLLETKPGDEFVSTACLMAEELAYQCAALASYLMLPIFFNRVVLQHLHGEQREQFLARCLAEPVFTAFAASEAAAGSDLMALQVTARRNGEGYVLDGRKEYSSNLRAADFVIVVARTGASAARATDAMSWFLLPTDTPGVEIGARWPTFGLRAIDVSPLELDGVIVPVERRLGGEGRGLPMMGSSLSMSRVGIAALGVGIARRARDVVVEHSKRRQIYGAKLNRMQDYRFRIADLEKNIAAARALVWTAAQKLDRGEDALKEASIAKLFSGEMVMNVAGAASAMLGSIGYTGQSPIEKLLRDARHVAIVEGPEPTHKELIFAHLLRHGGY
ncbi:MAG TPA: acyl-CoA dehydrogenase family protein [Candidatus Limnocylindrales bacterium]|jgi:alkylation response protein AidB-like acyl-CoA dehydrogenase|nr:acyl-CoA dehydrogenase family protein [Candidatus Limnocylindrales bacterium]